MSSTAKGTTTKGKTRNDEALSLQTGEGMGGGNGPKLAATLMQEFQNLKHVYSL